MVCSKGKFWSVTEEEQGRSEVWGLQKRSFLDSCQNHKQNAVAIGEADGLCIELLWSECVLDIFLDSELPEDYIY